MQKPINTLQGPPGGWHHKENGIPFPLNGSKIASLISVLKEVENYRLATGGDLNPGWEDRLLDQMCRENPEYRCIEDGDRKPRNINFQDVKRFLHVMAYHVQNGLQHVSSEEAARRESICMRCPMRTQESFCFGCKGLGEKARQVTQGKETPNSQVLGSCHVCGCLLKAKVWFPLEVLKKDGLDYPAYCWMNGPNPTEPTPQSN